LIVSSLPAVTLLPVLASFKKLPAQDISHGELGEAYRLTLVRCLQRFQVSRAFMFRSFPRQSLENERLSGATSHAGRDGAAKKRESQGSRKRM
jgi:hypothetical protein